MIQKRKRERPLLCRWNLYTGKLDLDLGAGETIIEDITSNDFSQNEEEDIYIESDLEKTQAQIRVEEITEALKKAQVEEQIEEDKYAKF